MSVSRCYLDFNATAPLRAVSREACVAALAEVGNPSSIHAEGRKARQVIETARAAVGRLVGSSVDGVIFTSGATEAANLLLAPGLRGGDGPAVQRILISATEHAAVRDGHRFDPDRVTIVPVHRQGTIDLDALREALASDGGRPAVLALQAANNETGVVQPVREAAGLLHAAGGLLVCDAVQAVGRVRFSIAESAADAVMVSGHKLGAPKGVGAAVLARGTTLGSILVRGGGQERGSRSGTENVAGIAGFGAAADEARERADEPGRLSGLQRRFEDGLRALCDDVFVFGASAVRLPNTTCFAIPGCSAETLLMAFDLEGVALSSGSACSSGKVSRSPVLLAMGVTPHLLDAALRVSFGWSSTLADVDRCLQAAATIMRRMHRRPVAAAA